MLAAPAAIAPAATAAATAAVDSLKESIKYSSGSLFRTADPFAQMIGLETISSGFRLLRENK